MDERRGRRCHSKCPPSGCCDCMVGLLLLVTALGFCSVKNKCQQRGETWQSSSLGRPAMAAEGPIVVSVGLCFSAFTGALFRMHLGLSGLAGGFLFGTAFG